MSFSSLEAEFSEIVNEAVTNLTATNATITDATITNLNGGLFGINQVVPVVAVNYMVVDPVTKTFVNPDAIAGVAFADGTENRIYSGATVVLKVGTYRVSYSLKIVP